MLVFRAMQYIIQAARVLAALLAALPVTLAVRPSAAQTDAAEAAQYRACLAKTETNPDAAYDDALVWRDRGGGVPAQHCAAVALVALGKYAEAATRLAGLADTPGGRAMAPGLLGQAGNAWLLAEFPSNAMSVLSAALSAGAQKLSAQEEADLRIDRARALAALERWNEAEVDLTKALSLDPERAAAYLFRATARRMENKLDLALEDLQLSLALAPKDPAALLERGSVYRLQQKPELARADWLAAIAAEPESKAAEAARGNLEKLDLKVE